MTSEPIGQTGGIGSMFVIACISVVAEALRSLRVRVREWTWRW
jgi:hypothetical protein